MLLILRRAALSLLAFAVASLPSCGGNVVVDASGGATTTTGSGGGEAPNPWIVPGPCTYTCDGAPCSTPCGPDQTPGTNPYACCSASGNCEMPAEPPAGVTATCPACPAGWTTPPSMALFCCLDGDCYSPATGHVDVLIFAVGPDCTGDDGSCECSLTSQDSHMYAVVCEAGACRCERDGATVKSVAWLCPASGPLDYGYVLWACDFPPM
jgi:hypothetical protein